MESSISDTKKPEGFLVYQRRIGSSSGETFSNTNKDISSHSESSFAQKDDKLEWKIGKDGHYFACVLCKKGGKLLCCDFCPGTYHLRCLYLKLAPKGEWKCPQCEHDDESKPLIHQFKHILSKKKVSSKKLKKDSSSSSDSKRD